MIYIFGTTPTVFANLTWKFLSHGENFRLLRRKSLSKTLEGVQLSRLDAILHAAAGKAAAKYDLRTKRGRRAFKNPEVYCQMQRLAPWLEVPAHDHSRTLPGVNLIGYAQGILGIGEDVRALAQLLRHVGVPFAIYNVELEKEIATSETSTLSGFFVDRPIFPVNIFCMPMFETERMRVEHGANLFAGRYNVGYWQWEVSTVPDYWRHAFDSMNEVWAISPYVHDVYSARTKTPIFYVPPYVNTDAVTAVDLTKFGLQQDDFVLLAMLDFNSYTARKNPLGTIEAFKQAFPDDATRERLLIKTINGHIHTKQLNELIQHVERDSRIVVIDGPLSRAENCGLIGAADCYVSLHRAEGFGRIIAESMLIGTPVVATDWSGSTCLLDATTGFPVAYNLVNVPAGDYVYAEGSQWADPCIEDAARVLRLVRSNRELAERKSVSAKKRVSENHGAEAVGKVAIDRIMAIGRAM